MSDPVLLIIGAARSGLAAAELARAEGANVLLHDDGIVSNEAHEVINRIGAGRHAGDNLPANVTELVLSPVIRLGHPLVEEARRRGLPVQSEVEFARARFRGKVLGVTGSNGKTTTTLLAECALRGAGMKVRACGNIGLPLSRVLLEADTPDWVALELSSYQLEHSSRLDLDAALLLNISTDHLERHGNLQAYLDAKLKLVTQLKPGGVLVSNADDTLLQTALKPFKRPALRFGSASECDALVDREGIRLSTQGSGYWLEARDCRLRGRHNLQNMAAVALAVQGLGLLSEQVRTALCAMSPVEHRIEPVATVGGVAWINDSKGTNVAATATALEGMPPGRVLLLAGGQSKPGEFSAVRDLVESRVRRLICYGRDGARIAHAFRELQDPVVVQGLAEAVKLAALEAREGDVVLLSPMCASFDQFNSYEERGTCFKQLVLDLAGAEGNP